MWAFVSDNWVHRPYKSRRFTPVLLARAKNHFCSSYNTILTVACKGRQYLPCLCPAALSCPGFLRPFVACLSMAKNCISKSRDKKKIINFAKTPFLGFSQKSYFWPANDRNISFVATEVSPDRETYLFLTRTTRTWS